MINLALEFNFFFLRYGLEIKPFCLTSSAFFDLCTMMIQKRKR
jgi:hypothetical protein